MASRRVVLLWALSSAGLASGACSLVLPFGDLSSDAGVDDTSDAGAVDADDARDGTSPADAADAPPPETDASRDAASAFPDGSWCAAQPPGMALCDDFDFESSPLERWTRQQFDVLGSSGYSLTAESPPHSFSIHMPSLTANSYFIEALEKDVAPAASASALSFSFSLEPSFPWEDAGEGGVTGDGFMLIANLSQGPGAPRTALSMDVEPTGTSLREQLTSADGGTSFPPPQYTSSVPQAGRWTHVVIDVDFASATATLSLDGAKVVTLALSGAWSASAATTVYLGDWYIHSTPSFELRYDNVIIRQR